MCGIFASFAETEDVAIKRLENVERLLRRRGPDFCNKVNVKIESRCCLRKNYSLVLFASVLHLRGDSLVGQPFQDEFGNVLLWNGELFDEIGDKSQANTNDTQLLAQTLSLCNNDVDILKCIARLRGPFAFVYWCKSENKLWFGRDVFGRRSLCCNRSEALFTIASVVDNRDDWIEVACNGVYCIDFNLNDSLNPCLFPWKSEIFDINTHMFIASPINVSLNVNIENDEEMKLLSEADAVVDEFLSVLDSSVCKRVKYQNNVCRNCYKSQLVHCKHPLIAILFSGGLDSTVIALLASNHLHPDIPIDLINVAFDHKAPDRRTALIALDELRELCPHRVWNFVTVDITSDILRVQREECIKFLIQPLQTVLDDSIGCSLWFAARGEGSLNGQFYESPAKIVLLGMGADEQLAGYTRHRRVYDKDGLKGLLNELKFEMRNISSRNLGRDDRIVSDSGREARFPFLDETVVNYLNSLPIGKKCNLDKPRGFGEKLLLRMAAAKLGLRSVCKHQKRAIQFGSGIAKLQDRGEKASDFCGRLSCSR